MSKYIRNLHLIMVLNWNICLLFIVKSSLQMMWFLC